MNKYQINIKSKTKKSLNNFLHFFYKSLKSYQLIDKYFPENKKKKIVSILKSPHVNKKAQEQFQFNIYFKNINLDISQYLILLSTIKKIKFNLFLDVKIKIKFLINNNLITQSRKKIFDPNNFKLNFLSKKYYYNNYNFKKVIKNRTDYKIKSLKKNLNFFKIMDVYGELYF